MSNPLLSRLRSLLAIAALAAGALLTADSALATTKIGVLLKAKGGFWDPVAEGCRTAAKRAGVDLVLMQPDYEADVAMQLRMLDDMMHQGVQGLIIAPCSTAALSGPVAEVLAKGTKVVVLDSPLDVDMPAYIATNHTDAGTAAGALLASVLKPGDEVTFLRHTKTSGATLLRDSSAYSAICAVYPHLLIHRDIFTGSTGEELARARLVFDLYPHTNAVLATGTPGSMAMLQVLKDTGRAGKVAFVGFGFDLNRKVAKALADGTMTGWIAQLPHEIGSRGIDAMLALLNHQTVPEVTYCNFLVITKQNLNDPSVQALMPR
ncbi:MAG TPA: substrate-binding domain-containing protein [Opitutaceae bacterium]